MAPKKRKMVASKEPGNLKRFRQDMALFVGEEDEAKKASDTKMTRKQKRKEQRQLTKMRKLAYRQGKELPTADSLQKERDAKTAAEKKRQKRAMKRKRRREKQKEKQEEAEETAAQAHADMEAANKQEDKVIKELEKQLGLKGRKSKSLPKGFINDGLDFLLDAVDPEKLKAIYDGDDYEDDLTAPILGPDSDEEEGDEGSSDEHSSNDMEDDLDSTSDNSDQIENIEIISEDHEENVKGIIKKTKTDKKGEKQVMFEEDETSLQQTSSKEKLGEISKLVSNIKSDTSKSKTSRLDALAKLVADEVSKKKKVPTATLR